MYVRIKGCTKLGGRVCEGHWLGIDNESKGIRVYWPESKKVTVERNIYYDNSVSSAGCLEEEQEALGLTKMATNETAQIPLNPPAAQIQENPDESTVDSDADASTKRVWKPLKVADLLKGGKGALVYSN